MIMDAAISSSSLLPLTSSNVRTRVTAYYSQKRAKPSIHFLRRGGCYHLIVKHRSAKTIIASINDVSSALDQSPPVEVTWQIVVGAIAGVTPFIVAGIEFSKRIIAQRRCVMCEGSGLVLRDKDYFRCPECGGFLPWQSWKRFFSG